jgi:RNA polymerase sigma-70 factor, ECF subfamily
MSLTILSNVPSPEQPRLALVSDDHEWVARIGRGDQAAFEAMYLAYYQPLCGFALFWVRQPDVAEELVQDVLCWIWERRAEWRPTGTTVRGYLFRAVRNRAFNYLKRQERERRLADAVPGDASAPGMGRQGRTPDVDAEHTDFDGALTRALGELAPRCREACILHWRHELTYPEVAEAMGITVKGAEALVTRGIKSLRTALGAFADSVM